MTIDEFRAHLGHALGLDPAELRQDATFRDELGFDSLRLLELAVALDELGLDLPEEVFDHLVSVDDAYYYYVTKSGHEA